MKKFLKDGMEVHYREGSVRYFKDDAFRFKDGAFSMALDYYDDNLIRYPGKVSDFDIVKVVWERKESRQIYNPLTGKKIDISEESYQAMKKDWK
jgi:hypothetical protein